MRRFRMLFASLLCIGGIVVAQPLLAQSAVEPLVPIIAAQETEPLVPLVTGASADAVVTPGVDAPDIGLAVFLEAPIVVAIVALIKRVKALDFFPAPVWTGIVAFIVWVGFLAARAYGVEGKYQEVADLIAIILPQIAQVVLILIPAAGMYAAAKASETPILGYTKPPDRQSPTQ